MGSYYETLFATKGIPVSAVAEGLINNPDDVTGVVMKLPFGVADEDFDDACKACAQDNGFYYDTKNNRIVQDATYLPNPNAEIPTTPTYRCCGFTFTGTVDTTGKPTSRGIFTPYTSGALRIIDMNPGPNNANPTLRYYDMKCQNGGTRTHPVAGGAQTYYCQCIQSIPGAGTDQNGLFEGERCTVPMSSFLHTNEIHGNFINEGSTQVQQTPMNPAQQRWRRAHPGEHPSPGQDVDPGSGIPLPIAAAVPVPTPSTGATAGATAGPTAPPSIALPPASTMSPASVSGQCSTTGVFTEWCKTPQCTDGCLAAQPPSTLDLAVGAASNSDRKVKTGDLKTGTLDSDNFCSNTSGDARCMVCSKSTGGDNATKACNAEPDSFKPAADAYEKCIANGRAMIHQDGVNRNQVSTWSAAQQSSLNQLLSSGANTTCSTWDNSSSSAGAGVGSWGAGVHSQSSTSVGAIGCEALFETSQALSEYNATLNCTLNSATNCQNTNVCSNQSIVAKFNITGDNDTVHIEQVDNQNVYAAANYTNQFTNSFANTTQQSLQSVINQFNSQVQDFSAQGSTPIASGNVSSVPSQGAREFSNIASAISNITMNAVSNQISNKQITDVVSSQELKAHFNVSGSNDTVTLSQTSDQSVHVSEITQNNVNNSFSNATTQLLTAKTTQGNTVNSPFSILLIAIIGVCVIGAIVAAIFIGKFVVKTGSKILHRGKKPQAPSAPAKAPSITLVVNTSKAAVTPAAAQSGVARVPPTVAAPAAQPAHVAPAVPAAQPAPVAQPTAVAQPVASTPANVPVAGAAGEGHESCVIS